jgi:putative glycerol-1-phosphate prenyltransferase
MEMDFLNKLKRESKKGRKQFAVLVDPDKSTAASLKKLAVCAQKSHVDFFFFGGSLLRHGNGEKQIRILRENSPIPVILFPGSSLQIFPNAHGILLLSLISGRNPDMLIGKHVESAAILKASGLEIIPTGYILVESGSPTSVSYISNTLPVPSNKPDIAASTALAGEMLGLKVIYLDAGSGAMNPVPADMICRVKKEISIPLIVGGGITDPGKAEDALKAGADVIVIGNAIEKNPGLIAEISEVVRRRQ